MGSGQGQGRVHFSEFCCSSTLLSKPKQTFLSVTFPPPAAYICRHLCLFTFNCKNNNPLLCPIKAWWLVLIEPDCLLFPLLYCLPLMSWFPLRGVQAHALRYSSCRPSVKIATSDWLASCHQEVTFEAALLLLLRATWEILMCKTWKGTASLQLSFLWFLAVHWRRVQAFQGSCLEGKQNLISIYLICSITVPACCLPYVWKGQFWYLLFPKISFWLAEI